MKRSIILTLSIALVFASYSQQIPPKEDWKETDYYKKGRHQNTAAWILTGTGTMGLVVTAAADATQEVGDAFVTVLSFGTVEPEHKSYTVPYLLSTVVMASGIYLFIASSKNKQKARNATVVIDMEKADILQGTVFVSRSFPTVGIKIRL
jgi:hypothetical protein